MKLRFTLHFFAIVISLCSFSSPASSKEENTTPLTISVVLTSTPEYQTQCEEFTSNVATYVKNEKRFPIAAKELSNLTLHIRCADAKVAGRIMMETDSDPLEVASYTTKLTDVKLLKITVTAQIFWTKVTEKLPWSGEVVNIKEVTNPSPFTPNADKMPLKARGTTTVQQNLPVPPRDCQPVELGDVTSDDSGNVAVFRSEFTGLLREIRGGTAKFEVYSKNDPTGSSKRYFLNLIEPAKVSKSLAQIAKYCRLHPEEAASATLADMMANVFGKDAVEVTSVQQRFGLTLMTLKGGNGASSKFIAAGYLHNRVLLGQSFMLDAFGIRHVYSKPYSNIDINQTDPPEVSVGELFTNLRYKRNRMTFALGGGLILEKINIPYLFAPDPDLPDLKRADVRHSSARFGMMLGGNYIGERTNFGIRLPIAQSQGKVYANFHTYFAYRISKTWLTGGDFILLSSKAKEPLAPTVTLIGLGGFLGIEIGR